MSRSPASSAGLRATLVLIILAAAVLGASAAASAAALPAVQITYSGSMSIEVFPAPGKPSHQLRSISWTATANSAGSDGALALDFTSVSGSSSLEGTGNCDDSTATISLATARNPVGSAWSLGETSGFPAAGWKFIAAGVPEAIPVLEDRKGRCSSAQVEELAQPSELLLKQETFSPAQLGEYEAILDPLEFTPGLPAGRTRTFAFDGTSHCTCLGAPARVKESMTLTVSATSPDAGNTGRTEPAPGRGRRGPTGRPPSRKVSEARRSRLKERAREDLGPALERDWTEHGLSAALGLTPGLTLSTALSELGQQGLLADGDEATRRVINDYRIIADPPDPHFQQLAVPHARTPTALRSCAASTGGELATCTNLREALSAMLLDGARAGALTEALLVTMNRDSGAIRARAYAAAQRQYVHFEGLHSQLRGVLASHGADGARVAAILRGAGASGVLSRNQAARFIRALEAELSRGGIGAVRLGRLAGHALEAREVDALTHLSAPTG